MAQTTLRHTIPTLTDVETRLHTTSRRLVSAQVLLLLILAGAVVGAFILVLTLGTVDIPTREVLEVVLGGEASKLSWTKIVYNFRLPKALTATLAGAALGVSGLQMQTFFRNPLAGPDV